MAIYKKTGRSEDSYRVVISYRGDRREWLVHGTRADAEAFEARKRVELERTGRQELRVVPRFCDFCVSQYRLYAEQHLKARTWSNRQYTIRTLVDHIGDLQLTDINRHTLERYQHERTRLGIRPATVNDEIKILKAILSYAKAIGVPVCDFKPPPSLPIRGKRRRITAWTDSEVQRLLAATLKTAPHIYPLVVFLLNTGCRKGEALALEWSCVDLRRKLIRIEPNEEWQPKNNRPREVPISDALLPFLSGERKSTRWVFPTRDGGRYVVWPQRSFDRARVLAGLSGGPHTTRHTFATHFLASTPDIYLLARILGHSDIGVTKLYGHLLPDHLDRARGAVSFGAPVGPAELEARLRWEAKQ